MVVTATALTRSFGDLTAVDRLTVDLPEGGVIGLVGPNGSGKSTLIRMLLGLVEPTSGEGAVLGCSIADPTRYAAQVGALIEGPAFVPGLSARANLTSLALLRGLPAARVEAVLDQVGLTGRDREPVRRFSLGMKQRLGIAAALLPDPRLLILDEPTNGLDPAGIVEMRSLLQGLGRSGHTVVVSSHLLSEIESICGYLVVIRFGVLLYAGPVAELLERTTSHVDLTAEHAHDGPALAAALSASGWDVVPEPADARLDGRADRELGRVRIEAPVAAAAQLNRDAAAAGYTLQSLTARRDSLEAVFLQMTGDVDGELSASRAAAAERSRSHQSTRPGRRARPWSRTGAHR